MTGYRSKKMSADIRWLGPYAPADRHADDVTLAHVVELRKKVADLERYCENALSGLSALRQERDKFKEALINIRFEYNCRKTKISPHFIGTIAREALEGVSDAKSSPTIRTEHETPEQRFLKSKENHNAPR